MRNPNAKVSKPNSFVTNSGSPFHVLYSSKVLGNGKVELLESGKEDIQELIDSYRDTTDMSFIVHQLMLGNESVVNVRSGAMYGDFTSVPSSLAEAQQMMIDAENAFYELPLDVRSQFDNDWMKWQSTVGSDEWVKKMEVVTASSSLDDPVEASVAEVKEVNA